MFKKVITCITAASLALSCMPAYAATSDEIRSEIEEYQDELSAVEEKSEDTTEKINEAIENIEAISSEIKDTALAMEDYRDGMGERIRYFYENGQGYGILEAILSSGSFVKMLEKIEMQTALYEYDMDCLKSYKEYADKLSQEEDELAEYQNELDALLAEQNGEIEDLNDSIAGKQEEYDIVKTEEEEAARRAAEEQKKAEEATAAAKQLQDEGEAVSEYVGETSEAAEQTVAESTYAGSTGSGYTGYESVSVSDAQMDVASKVYSVLKALGWTNEQISGALANMETECGFDFTAVESIYTEKFVWGPKKQNAAACDYIMSAVHPGYQFTKVYRCGIGLIQWTDTTNGATGNSGLRAYAAAHGCDWYNLDIQLEYLIDPNGDSARSNYIRNYHNYNKYGTDNPYSGTYWWSYYIEGCLYQMDGRVSKAYAWADKLNAGEVYYNEEYANQILSAVGLA